MKLIILFAILGIGSSIFAHDNHYENVNLREWTYAKTQNTKRIKASFLSYNENTKIVNIENRHNHVYSIPLLDFSEKDQLYIIKRYDDIKAINQKIEETHIPIVVKPSFDLNSFFIFLFFILLSIIAFYKLDRQKFRYALPIFIIGISISLFSFMKKLLPPPAKDYTEIDKSFIPFKPNVMTRADANYVYVESVGIPTEHEMMIGITGWQQQFPIPQCYNGSNAWSIPLNPTMATTPIPVNASHFSRGAIALAANGIPIFNPYTNTGVDAYVDGQLDNFGGHCGRADDYHYHAAPLSLFSTLINKTTETVPFAYALDGFAIYGSKEPDGSAMTNLDVNHGHVGADGNYHYHATNTLPYMIGNMVGKVTEDATNQIIPQAQATPIRPAGSPLNGAKITHCLPNSTKNGYTLSYTLNNQNYSVEYNWTTAGFFTFNNISPTVTTIQTYDTKKSICKMGTTTSSVSNLIKTENLIHLYPNPSRDILYLSVNPSVSTRQVTAISIYNFEGKMIFYSDEYRPSIELKKFARGNYILKAKINEIHIVKNIIIE